MATTHEPVVFQNSLGEEISNDPYWKAQKTMAEYAAANGAPDDSDEAIGEDYKSFDGKALKAMAKKRGVDITGLKTVGAVRDALIAADAEDESEADIDEDTEDDTDDDSE